MPVKKVSAELPRPWPEFLAEVDRTLPIPVHLYCIGGFVLTALYGLPRATADIDYVEIMPREAWEHLERIGGRDSALAKKHKVYFQSVGIEELPEDYGTRLEELDLDCGLTNLHLYVLEPYDLVLSKLYRNNPKDREDVKFLAAKLSLQYDTLYSRWSKEMKPWIPNADRLETTITVFWKEYFL